MTGLGGQPKLQQRGVLCNETSRQPTQPCVKSFSSNQPTQPIQKFTRTNISKL